MSCQPMVEYEVVLEESLREQNLDMPVPEV